MCCDIMCYVVMCMLFPILLGRDLPQFSCPIAAAWTTRVSSGIPGTRTRTTNNSNNYCLGWSDGSELIRSHWEHSVLSVTAGGKQEVPGGGTGTQYWYSVPILSISTQYRYSVLVLRAQMSTAHCSPTNDCVVPNDTSAHHMAGKTARLFQLPCRHCFLPAIPAISSYYIIPSSSLYYTILHTILYHPSYYIVPSSLLYYTILLSILYHTP